MNREIELILNSTHDAMIAVNKKGIITVFNKAASRLTGIDPSVALDHEVTDVVENTRLKHILDTGVSELNRKQPLGNTTIITNRMPVLDEDGNVIGAIAVFRDISEVQDLAEKITDLREVRSTLEAIFNATGDAISVVDENGMNIMINPAYTKLTGYTPKDVMGKYCTTDLSEGESVHLRVLETREPVKGVRIFVGPTKREVLVEAAPIMNNDKLIGSVAVIHDLTEINRLVTELDQAKQIIRNLEAKYTFDDIKGGHQLMINTIEKARLAASTPATVILRGESGTGKELFAHAIHNASKRKYSQFVRVNCAAISENLLESELFGYEEGAFTGALKGGKMGLFERADGGTIFLDEIGEVPSSMQAKLLRVLQEKEVLRVGGTKSIPVNVRVISATNVDLEKAIENSEFRQDLYYRLNVFPIRIPPLRDHKDDLDELIMHLINKFNQEYGRSVTDISSRAMEMIKSYDWPGNIRELENFIGRAIINMKINEKIIMIEHLPKPEALMGEYGEHIEIKNEEVGFSDEDLDMNLSEVAEKAEREYIIKVLRKFDYIREDSAKALNISVRSLYYKIKKYKIEL